MILEKTYIKLLNAPTDVHSFPPHFRERPAVTIMLLPLPCPPLRLSSCLSSAMLHTAPSCPTARIGCQTCISYPVLLCLLFPAVRFALFLQSSSPDNVSFAGYVYLLTPSPCGRLSLPQSIMGQSDSLSSFSHPLFQSGRLTCHLRSEDGRVSQVPDSSLHACHVL